MCLRQHWPCARHQHNDDGAGPCWKASEVRALALALQQAGSGVTLRLGLQQVLEVAEIGFELSLRHADGDRLGELEEAARPGLEGEVEPCASTYGLKGGDPLHRYRSRGALGREPLVRLILGAFVDTFDLLAQELPYVPPGRAHAHRALGGQT